MCVCLVVVTAVSVLCVVTDVGVSVGVADVAGAVGVAGVAVVGVAISGGHCIRDVVGNAVSMRVAGVVVGVAGGAAVVYYGGECIIVVGYIGGGVAGVEVWGVDVVGVVAVVDGDDATWVGVVMSSVGAVVGCCVVVVVAECSHVGVGGDVVVDVIGRIDVDVDVVVDDDEVAVGVGCVVCCCV